MTQYTEPRPIRNEDEVSLLDIIRFFRLNWKFLGLITLVLSSAAVTLSLSKPQTYQKQLTLSIELLPQGVLSQSISVTNKDDVGSRVVAFLQKQKLDQLTALPTYNASTQQIDLTLKTPNPSTLAGASSKVTSQVNAYLQKQLDRTIQNALKVATQKQKRYQEIGNRIEQQINQLPVTTGNTPEALRAEARLRALEDKRAELINLKTAQEVDEEYLEQALRNPAQFSGQIMSVQVLTESDVRQTSSPLQVVAIAVIASFMVAVLAAILRVQVPRLKYELSKETVDKSTED